jgi:hypothetical protein
MIFLDTSVEEWCAKYPGLKVMVSKCDACGAEMRTSRAFLSKGYAGLETPKCPCGRGRNTASTAVTTDESTRQSWSRFV